MSNMLLTFKHDIDTMEFDVVEFIKSNYLTSKNTDKEIKFLIEDEVSSWDDTYYYASNIETIKEDIFKEIKKYLSENDVVYDSLDTFTELDKQYILSRYDKEIHIKLKNMIELIYEYIKTTKKD